MIEVPLYLLVIGALVALFAALAWGDYCYFRGRCDEMARARQRAAELLHAAEAAE